MKNIKSIILGVATLVLTLGLNFRHVLDDYGILNNKLHVAVLAQTNGSGGSTSGGGSTSSGGDSSYSCTVSSTCLSITGVQLGSVSCTGKTCSRGSGYVTCDKNTTKC